MFSRKKKTQPKSKPSRDGKTKDLMFGEFGIGVQDSNVRNDEDDELEAELFALTGGKSKPKLLSGLGGSMDLGDDDDLEAELLELMGGKKSKLAKKKKLAPEVSNNHPKKETMTVLTKDITELSFDDGDEDIDENDPELLQELEELNEPEEDYEDENSEEEEEQQEQSLLDILKERLESYKVAEKKAKESNEMSRARRFARGIKTLEGQVKLATAGQPVNMSEIPPMIATNLKPATIVSNPNEDTSQGNEKPFQPDEKPIEEPSQVKEEPSVLDIIKERLNVYQTAEEKAKEMGDLARVRRFARGIKTLKDQLRQVESGRTVSVSEIPPMIATNLKPASEVNQNVKETENIEQDTNIQNPIQEDSGGAELPKPENNETNILEIIHDKPQKIEESLDSSEMEIGNDIKNQERLEDTESIREKETQREPSLLATLKERRNEYKKSALTAKQAKDMSSALFYVKTVKILDALISDVEAGKKIDENSIPPHVEEARAGSTTKPTPGPSKPSAFRYKVPTTVMEALEQRLQIYKAMQVKAKTEGNQALALQNAKIVRIYLQAIELHKHGKAIPLNLPTPPGCPPIPIAFQF